MITTGGNKLNSAAGHFGIFPFHFLFAPPPPRRFFLVPVSLLKIEPHPRAGAAQ